MIDHYVVHLTECSDGGVPTLHTSLTPATLQAGLAAGTLQPITIIEATPVQMAGAGGMMEAGLPVMAVSRGGEVMATQVNCTLSMLSLSLPLPLSPPSPPTAPHLSFPPVLGTCCCWLLPRGSNPCFSWKKVATGTVVRTASEYNTRQLTPQARLSMPSTCETFSRS